MRAACIQQQIEPCKNEKNLARAVQMAGSALDEGAQILVYPELFLTGFCYGPFLKEDQIFSELDPFRELVEAHECLIIGSLRSGRQNLGFCLDLDGLELRPKIHPYGEEKLHFEGGDFISPVATNFGQVGLQICYDLRFPEVARSLALQGADFLVTVAQFPSSRVAQWRALNLARAIENQIPHLACNWANGGGSLIINAQGMVEAEAGAGETIIWGNIDLAERDDMRREIPCFADRRPEIY